MPNFRSIPRERGENVFPADWAGQRRGTAGIHLLLSAEGHDNLPRQGERVTDDSIYRRNEGTEKDYGSRNRFRDLLSIRSVEQEHLTASPYTRTIYRNAYTYIRYYVKVDAVMYPVAANPRRRRGIGTLLVRSSVTKVPVFYRNLALVAKGGEDRWQTGTSAFQLPLGRLSE